MRKLVLVVFLTLTAYLTNAQKPTNAQVRQMNLMAIELLDRYELNSALWDKQAKSRFPRMFESRETEIFCDLYHNVDYYGNQISVDKYISFIEDTNSKIDKVQLSNIKKKDIWSNDGKWYYSLTFDKLIIYWDGNGVLFPMGVDDNGDDAQEIFNLEMTLVFDANLEKASIHSLVSPNADAYERVAKAIIVQKCDDKNQKFEQEVTSDRHPLRYNSFDQAVVSSYNFKHPDEDVWIEHSLICQDDAYDLIQLKYNVSTLRLKLRNEIAPMMYSMVNNPNDYRRKSFGYSIGVDLGTTFRLGQKTKGGLFVGAALTMSKFTAYTEGVGDYTLCFTGDNGKMVERSYSIDEISQKASFTDLTIPIYFNLESKLTRSMSLIFDLGTKVYVSINQKCDDAVAVGRVNGEKYSGVYAGSSSIMSNVCDASLFFSAGVDYAIVPRRLYLEGKIGYERGFGRATFAGASTLMQDDYPVIYDGTTGEDVLVAPLLNDVSISKSALWIGIGLKLKF